VAAVRDGKFHIWSVETIDQGIEILTGVPAGERLPDGNYPEGSINFLVDKRLRELVEHMKKFSAPEKEEKKKNGDKTGGEEPAEGSGKDVRRQAGKHRH